VSSKFIANSSVLFSEAEATFTFTVMLDISDCSRLCFCCCAFP
jgi:hypothetical protein